MPRVVPATKASIPPDPVTIAGWADVETVGDVTFASKTMIAERPEFPANPASATTSITTMWLAVSWKASSKEAASEKDKYSNEWISFFRRVEIR
jgi:hypothetical protein